jgi:adapter protein MecA 1/2
MSYDDLEERDIDLDTFNYNSPETQELFWDLMEEAEIEFGFETQESQLSIEAVSDVDHGFVITITRIDEDNEFESFQKFIKNRYKKKDLAVKKKTSNVCSTMIIYAVETFDDLCRLCAAIKPVYAGRSKVYALESNYYLVLSSIDGNVQNQKLFDSILSEYADRMPNVDFFEGYLNEYGKCLMGENAVSYFANL